MQNCPAVAASSSNPGLSSLIFRTPHSNLCIHECLCAIFIEHVYITRRIMISNWGAGQGANMGANTNY